MWDGRGDAYEPVEVPVRPDVSYRLGPRWPLWLALLPVVGALVLGVGIAVAGFGSIEVLEAPIVPRTPVLTLPPSAPQELPPPPLADSLVPTPTAAAPADRLVASTPPTAVLTPAPEEVVSAAPSSSVTTSPTNTTTTTTMAEPEPPIPRTADDCRNGGWRELVDDTGHPFTNQGDCIRFVDREGQDP